MKGRIVFILLFTIVSISRAQPGFDPNGVADVFQEKYALVGVHIFTGDREIKNGTLIVNGGKIEQVGENISIPNGYTRYEMPGICVYPSFIDLYSQYGLPAPPNPKHSSNQFNSDRRGPWSTNEAIKSDTRAAALFSPDQKNSEALGKIGFGVMHSFMNDGIARGTGCLVFIGKGQPHDKIVKTDISRNFSFQRGSSSQDYPRSLMGAIALLRQTLYDAQWYASNPSGIKDLGLEAIVKSSQLPVFFEAGSFWNIFRAATLANEFQISPIIKGTGEEYQRIKELKSLGAKLIIPLDFPAPFEVKDSFSTRYVAYKKWIHWANAPFNLSLISREQIPFCITVGDPSQFWKNAQKAFLAGLSPAEFLRSLTTRPAEWLGMKNEIGTLQPGAFANFFLSTDTLFGNSFYIFRHYIQGKAIIQEAGMQNAESGVYTGPGFIFRIQKEKDSVIYVLQHDGWASYPVLNEKMEWKNKSYTFRYSNGKYTFIHEGISYTASRIRGIVDPEKGKKISLAITNPYPLRYPLTEYGDPQTWESKKPGSFLIKDAQVWTGIPDEAPKKMDVLIADGKILQVGQNIPVLPTTELISGTNIHLTPGIIDEHSHIAIHGDVNEGTQSVTSEVRIGDVINAEDVNIYRQLSGGVTSSHLLHGSANTIGGQTQLVKLRWGAMPENMKMKPWPGFIKFALGENVKQSNWGDQANVRFPQSRMGVEQTLYDAFWKADYYRQQKKSGKLVRRDLELDALVEIMEGKRNITCHSYVQSEINMLMHVADSMKFKVNTFTHILEGYKVADKMVKHGAAGSTFSDWWAYKYEVMEAIPYNAALMDRAGILTGINSDDAEMARRLNQEAAKSIKYGNMSPSRCMAMVTHNPAKMLKVLPFTGTIEPGKAADMVLWNGNPLEIQSKPLYTWVDGILLYDINKVQQLREEGEKIRIEIWKKMNESGEQKDNAEKPVFEAEELWDCGHEVNHE